MVQVRTWLERQAEAAALEVASTALPSLMQSLVSVTAAATASALTRAACASRRLPVSAYGSQWPDLCISLVLHQHCCLAQAAAILHTRI